MMDKIKLNYDTKTIEKITSSIVAETTVSWEYT